jgi:PQQ-dependent catabolism-associated CXXCW motif protein
VALVCRREFALGLAAFSLSWRATAGAANLAGTTSVAGAAPVAEPQGYWLGDVNSPVPATLHGATVLRAEGVAAVLKRGSAVVIDASNAPRQPEGLAPGAPWMPLPHRGIPDTLWIPGAGEGAVPPEFEEFFRSRLAQATFGKFDAPLIVYCHERCWLSWNAAKRAIGLGYRQVYWFAEGIEGWIAAGQPTAVIAPLTREASAMPRLAVLDLELSGDLGGPEFAAEHEARLKAESARLRLDLERSQLYRVLDPGPAQATIDRLKSQQLYLHDCNGCDLEVGRQLHADQVLVAWVNRVSGLILTLTYEIHDVATEQIIARKSYDFRGDNDIAWNHAIDYMVRDIKSDAAAPRANSLGGAGAGWSSFSHLATNVDATALPTTLVALRPISSK